ncbi:hypothetical protein G7054_g10176 [Neopestalotiopsis clavispora]|nr:hypothetical protein G7054_g10176 [Neopestalotiopsis clavispora]
MHGAALTDEAVSSQLASVGAKPNLARNARASEFTAMDRTKDLGEHRRLPLSFLLNFTDEKQDFVTERAVGEEPDGDLLGPTNLSPPGDEMFDFIDPTLLLPCDSEAWLGALQDTEEQGLLGSFAFPAGQGLAARLELLESEIAAHAHTSPLPRSPFDSDAFHRFFTHSNVNTFATIFCRKRHYQHQVIHWPTFSLEKASLPLLMVVALTGATYSFHPGNGPEHITAARSFYRLADSYVFHELRRCVGGGTRPCDMAESIELCQAALLMYALDTLLAGDEGVQCSAMMERLPALISTMRKLKFIGCRHDPSEDWVLFLQREQIIRLVSWAYGSDCLVTMSFNTPPFLSLMEMTGDLPCHPVLWDSDPTTLDSLRSLRDTTSHCLKDLMSWLLDDDMQPSETLAGVPLFHLHIMLCGSAK